MIALIKGGIGVADEKVLLGDEIDVEGWSPKYINLKPYKDFMAEVYQNKPGEEDAYTASRYAKKAIRLMDYYKRDRNRTFLFYLRARSEYRKLFETTSTQKNSDTVADGERKAHQDEAVVEARRKRDFAKIYKAYMDDLMEVLSKLHYQFRNEHEEAEKEWGRAGYDD